MRSIAGRDNEVRRWNEKLARDLALALVSILLFLPLIHHADLQNPAPTRMMIYVSDESVIERASELGVDYKEIEQRVSPLLVEEAERRIESLRNKGLTIELIDVLTHTAHIAVVDTYDSDEEVRGELGIGRVFADSVFEVHLQKSAPLVGARAAQNRLLSNGENLTGRGVVVAIVDTGIDYNHPDLGAGFGPRKKVIGGYDFVDEDADPMDEHGHGTHVAGIVAARGGIVGIAPDSNLLAYRVVENGGRVRTSSLARAIEMAVRDGADVINLSLGSRFEVGELRSIVRNAIDAKVIVVAAVGNSGPITGSIGAPASQTETIAVGADYNDRPTRLGSVRIDDEGIEIVGLPMEDSVDTKGEVSGEIVFVKYGRQKDLDGLDLRGKIALAERRGETPDEIVYFSTKEASVAERGASALIVFNTEAGIARGRLKHENNPLDYEPSIPTIFITKEDGLRISESIKDSKATGSIAFENKTHAGMVSLFSSRGPVSPFYIKPDLVSPGERVNSTWLGGAYSMEDGTSFAAPHVTGGVALLLQKHGEMSKDEVLGILGPSATPLLNSFGMPWPVDHQGSGRLDLAKAVRSPISIIPHQVAINLASRQLAYARSIRIESLLDSPASVSVVLDWRFASSVSISTNSSSLVLSGKEPRFIGLSAELLDPTSSQGRLEGRLIVNVESEPEPLALTLPIVVNVNTVSINLTKIDQGYRISPSLPSKYDRATVRVSSPNLLDEFQEEILQGQLATFTPKERGEYWVEVSVFNGESVDFGGMTFFAGGEEESRDGVMEMTQSVPIRFIEILLGSITLIAIGASLYLLFASGKGRRTFTLFVEGDAWQ